jgi:hypothetical protein
MKNLKLLLVAFLAVVAVSSCMKDDNNYEQIDWEKEQARLDSTKDAQQDEIKAYAEANLNPERRKYNDSLGIWFEVLPTTAEVDSTFEYIQSGASFMPVTASVKYSEKSLDGKYSKNVTTATRASIQTGYAPGAWLAAFYPNNINGRYYPGLLPKGLLKNVKIRLITPSIYYYDLNEVADKDGTGTLPPNSPLDVIIDVVEIGR